ncbi:MAG: hypothetical protein GY867_06155 [bacterium]|nr:hypothetical protein [bacterium]
MKRKDLWLFLARLLSLTSILGYLWFFYWQVEYPFAIGFIAKPFFDLVGVKKWYMALLLDHFTNLVPFVALVLSTPGLFRRWRKSLAVLVGGLAIILCFQLLLSWAVYELISRYAMSPMYIKLSLPLFFVNDALPLVLWLAFYPKMPRQLFGLSIFAADDDTRKVGKLRSRLKSTKPG